MLSKFKTTSAKGVLSILTGGVISKLVWAVFGLFLSKYYGAENYGIYNVFIGYIGIISIISTLRLENVLVITKGLGRVMNFYKFLIVLSIFGSLLISFFAFLISLAGEGETMPINFWLIVLAGSLASSWVLIQNALFTKLKFFNAISVGLILSTITAIFFQCLFYFLLPDDRGFYGLILGHLIGVIISIVYYFKITNTRNLQFDYSDSKILIHENLDILKYAFPSESINTLANNLFIILAAIYFNQIEIGVFALAIKILATPMVLLFNAFSKVYFQRSAQLFRTEPSKLMGLTLKVSAYSGMIYLAYLVFINTIGIYFLEMFYSPDEWPDLSLYLLTISSWVAIRSFVSPVSQIAIVINKNQFSLWMNIGLLLSNFLGVYIGYKNQSFFNALLVFSISASFIYLVFYLTILLYLRKYKA